jgi:hypothetical protein
MSRNWFTPVFANFGLKLSALVISLGIWFYANSRLTDEVTFWAVVTINPPQGYALVYQSDTKARVTVSGPRSLVSRIRGEFMPVPLRLTTTLDERDLRDGQASLPMDKIWHGADLPERDLVQLRLRDADLKEVRVIASPLIERKLPVNVRASVQMAPGFVPAASPTATPAEVRVRGPALALNAMTGVDTQDLPLDNVLRDWERRVELRPEVAITLPTGEQAVVPFEVEPSTVTVNGSVAGEEQKEQRYPGVPLLQMSPPGFPYQAEFDKADSTVTVIVRASPTSLDKLEAAQIRAYVDLSPLASEQVAPGTSQPHRQPVQVQLPTGIPHGEARANPDHVIVVLKNLPH